MPFRGKLEYLGYQFSSVQSSHSVLSDSLRPHETAVSQTSLSITTSQNLLRIMSIELVMPSKHLIFYHSLSSCFNLSQHQDLFQWVSSSHKWPNYWRFRFSIRPSNEYSGLIIFTIDWLDLPAIQGTLKGLLQHHSSKASIFRDSAFFTVQHSHPYMTTGKIISLAKRTFVGNSKIQQSQKLVLWEDKQNWQTISQTHQETKGEKSNQ